MTALYGLNLTLISTFNTVLWLIAAVPRRDWLVLTAPVFTTAIFVIAAIVIPFAPYLAKYVWPVAFLSSALGAWADRRETRHGKN